TSLRSWKAWASRSSLPHPSSSAPTSAPRSRNGKGLSAPPAPSLIERASHDAGIYPPHVRDAAPVAHPGRRVTRHDAQDEDRGPKGLRRGARDGTPPGL